MKTYSAKPTDVQRDWYIVDAAGQTLGRIATLIASHLTGKNKPIYTAHIDCGDHVVVINAAQVKVTGNKLTDKKYYRHSGYPGGIKEISLEELLSKHPERAIESAVRGMLPHNKLQDQRMKRLKVYPAADHPHAPQSPKPIQGVTNG
ncbi:MAG TPA: 50S ribosomal protein L13 [Candidatus Dormibacteraeota bacterium]|nr:50S ribosomal protein L13 [Candidatus Dormibacteraeota bacterium]